MTDLKYKLYNHKQLDLLNIDPDLLTIDVIAKSMSNTCMFNNQCYSFYSVADSAIGLANFYMKDKKWQHAKYALLLNAAEPFIPYVTTRISPDLEHIRDNFDREIIQKYDLDIEVKHEVLFDEKSLLEKSIATFFPPIITAKFSNMLASNPSLSEKMFLDAATNIEMNILTPENKVET